MEIDIFQLEMHFPLFFLFQDLEKLVSVKARAERDPCGFVTALRNGVSILFSLPPPSPPLPPPPPPPPPPFLLLPTFLPTFPFPQTLEQLPTQQKVAEIPDINWKGYMDSVQKIVKQHSSVYQRTRRKAGKEPAALTRMVLPSEHFG